ncbi:MAG TPA: hypothetical protein VF699_10980 [Caulobacteraceae bacterium]
MPLLAAAIPVIAVVAVGATELATVAADKGKLQDVADAVAIDAAQELAFSVDAAVLERARVSAATQLASLTAARPGATLEVVPTLELDPSGEVAGLALEITQKRKSFFGNMLPPGGFVTKVRSVAVRMGKAPLCVLGLSPARAKTVNALDTSRLSAGKCLVHSNNEMVVENAAAIESEAAEVAGRASGKIKPAALVGAERITDPFASKGVAFPGSCVTTDKEKYDTPGPHYLDAGKHCKKIQVQKDAVVVLRPGEHYFDVDRDLEIQHTAKVSGDDVVLIFADEAELQLTDTARLDLKGRRSGGYAGFVVVTTRDHKDDFIIRSNNVANLLGTVYVPGARLVVDGSDSLAEESAWTVVVAESLNLRGSATLVINADYRGSPVPVPVGVGNKSKDKTKNSRLAR